MASLLFPPVGWRRRGESGLRGWTRKTRTAESVRIEMSLGFGPDEWRDPNGSGRDVLIFPHDKPIVSAQAQAHGPEGDLPAR